MSDLNFNHTTHTINKKLTHIKSKFHNEFKCYIATKGSRNLVILFKVRYMCSFASVLQQIKHDQSVISTKYNQVPSLNVWFRPASYLNNLPL